MEIIISQLTLPKHFSPILVLIFNTFILQNSLMDQSPKDDTKFIFKKLSAFFHSLLSLSNYVLQSILSEDENSSHFLWITIGCTYVKI